MKTLLSLFFLLLLMHYPEAKSQVKRDSVLESKIMDLILSLPEVKQANAYVIKHSHGRRHLFDYIHARPDKKYGDYWVKVSEDNGATYATHFNFFVNGKTFAIKYMDTISSEEVPLEVIRKDKKRHKILEYH